MTGAIGGLNLLLLILMKAKIEHDVVTQGQGMLQVSWGPGFWLAMFGYASTVAIVILLLAEKNPAEPMLEGNASHEDEWPAVSKMSPR